MELKTKYQYTYFIYPYVIKENKYKPYLLKLLKNKKVKPYFFEKERDFDIYSYFLPTVRDFLFQGFEFEKNKLNKFMSFENDMKSSILAKYPCSMFEYDLGKDIQGKAGEEEGIFFKLQKLQIICFNTGICFLVMKTNIENSNKFSDVLNFNYKFRDIYSELQELKEYENIRLQSDTFGDIKKLSELIKEITGDALDSKEYNINSNRFLTYGYTCIDQEDWNETKTFKSIESEFFKYVNILPNSYKSNFNKKDMDILNKWDYIKTGFSKEGMALLTSSIDIHNYTKLPHDFENQYLYTYILVQYQKMYLKKLEKECKNISMAKDIRNKFIKFTKELWIHEITNDDIGSNIYRMVRNISEVEKIYNNVKGKFNVTYMERNIEKDGKVNRIILIALIISLILNIVNFIVLINLM